jgi:hypothetical protein
MGFSQHAGMVICADGTPEAAKRLERVLWNDPASGVWRHADAGYQDAIDCAREHGLRLPGEDACVAELLGEPLIDLNLMVRAPLEGAVHQGGEKVHAEGLVACWLFALKPLPALFLATYDLLELLATVDHVVPRDALVLSVRRPG